MSSLRRTWARASQRSGEDLMKKMQPPGVYAKAEREYNEQRAKKRAARGKV